MFWTGDPEYKAAAHDLISRLHAAHVKAIATVRKNKEFPDFVWSMITKDREEDIELEQEEEAELMESIGVTVPVRGREETLSPGLGIPSRELVESFMASATLLTSF